MTAQNYGVALCEVGFVVDQYDCTELRYDRVWSRLCCGSVRLHEITRRFSARLHVKFKEILGKVYGWMEKSVAPRKLSFVIWLYSVCARSVLLYTRKSLFVACVKHVSWSDNVAKNENGPLVLNLETVCLTVYDTHDNFHVWSYIKWAVLWIFRAGSRKCLAT